MNIAEKTSNNDRARLDPTIGYLDDILTVLFIRRFIQLCRLYYSFWFGGIQLKYVIYLMLNTFANISRLNVGECLAGV